MTSKWLGSLKSEMEVCLTSSLLSATIKMKLRRSKLEKRDWRRLKIESKDKKKRRKMLRMILRASSHLLNKHPRARMLKEKKLYLKEEYWKWLSIVSHLLKELLLKIVVLLSVLHSKLKELTSMKIHLLLIYLEEILLINQKAFHLSWMQRVAFQV